MTHSAFTTILAPTVPHPLFSWNGNDTLWLFLVALALFALYAQR